MTERFQNHPDEVGRMNTQELRKAFVITDLMQVGKMQAVYSHYDRVVIGGIVPITGRNCVAKLQPAKSRIFSSTPGNGYN